MLPTNPRTLAERAARRQQLMTLSERITRAVSSVHGTVTKSESDQLLRLENELGERWDAVNQQWCPLPSYIDTCIEHGPGGTIRLPFQIRIF